jgi:hypothetical protein
MGDGDKAAVNYEQVKALARELGANTEDLIVLTSGNDPFYAGSDTQLAMAQWFSGVWEAKGFVGRGGVHLRRAHYQMLGNLKHDGSTYENDRNCWEYLISASRYARILGLVDPEDIIDRRNPEPYIFLNRPENEEEIGFEARTAEMTLPEISADLLFDLEWDLRDPSLTPKGYDYHPFHQPYHVEVWAEKSTMNDVLEPVCSRLSTNLVTGLGYMTITSVVALLRRIEETEKPARILYISDLDRAGRRMPISVARQCEFWLREYLPEADIRLEPIVLTDEQVEEYGLSETAMTDEETGEEKVELDALESLRPGELGRIVTENIERFRDERLRRRFEQTRVEAREVLKDALEEEVGEELAELEEIREEARPIVEHYQERVEELAEEMEDELEPLRVKLEGVRQSHPGKRFKPGARFACPPRSRGG